MGRYEQLEAFIEVVNQQSFSAAGDKLGVVKSVLSRRVSELESRLGVKLLNRTTRKLSLTGVVKRKDFKVGTSFASRSIAEDVTILVNLVLSR